MKLAENIIINAVTGEVTIDGESLGLYLADEEIDALGQSISVVRLPVMARSVTLIPREQDC